MEEKYTPGPWEVDGPRIYSTTKTLVATVGLFRSLETASANARLIAAAPDLLAALESLLEWAADVHDPMKQSRINYSGMDAARAAIAKAKGADHA